MRRNRKKKKISPALRDGDAGREVVELRAVELQEGHQEVA